MSLVLEVGFYGKLPSHGDFLRRRVSDAFVGSGTDGSRNAWRPAARLSEIGGSTCTSPARSGVSPARAASAVPRRSLASWCRASIELDDTLPLTLVAELPPETPQLLTAVIRAQRFFDAAEGLVIETLELEHVDFESFDEQLIRLGEVEDVAPAVVLDATSSSLLDDGAEGWQIPIGSTADLTDAFTQLMSDYELSGALRALRRASMNIDGSSNPIGICRPPPSSSSSVTSAASATTAPASGYRQLSEVDMLEIRVSR